MKSGWNSFLSCYIYITHNVVFICFFHVAHCIVNSFCLFHPVVLRTDDIF